MDLLKDKTRVARRTQEASGDFATVTETLYFDQGKWFQHLAFEDGPSYTHEVIRHLDRMPDGWTEPREIRHVAADDIIHVTKSPVIELVGRVVSPYRVEDDGVTLPVVTGDAETLRDFHRLGFAGHDIEIDVFIEDVQQLFYYNTAI